jgi:hypothetical protein
MKAVDFAHERGIVHRDSKSGNVLVTADRALRAAGQVRGWRIVCGPFDVASHTGRATLRGEKESPMRLTRTWQLLLGLLLATAAAAFAEDDPGTRLREAATRGDVAQVRALLDAGADANAASEYGATALHFACDKGHVEVVKLLLERGAKADAKDTFYGAQPVDWAGMKGHGEVLKLLAQAGADVTGGVTGAASMGKIDAIRPLLDAKLLDDKQLTMVLTAAKGAEQAEIVKLL